MWILDLPLVNALLNALSAVLLGFGYAAIRRKRIRRHRALMIGALVTSTGFLASYVTYHLNADSPAFPGTGWVRPLYFAMLISHIVLAAALVPLVLVTLILAIRSRFESHRRIARWTLPIWAYVSVTGVLIYIVVYRVYDLTPTLRGG